MQNAQFAGCLAANNCPFFLQVSPCIKALTSLQQSKPGETQGMGILRTSQFDLNYDSEDCDAIIKHLIDASTITLQTKI